MIRRMVPWLIAAVLAAGLPVGSLPAWAATGESSGPSFQVEPVYPENQRERKGYFDLRVEPGQRQELVLLVDNLSNEEMRVEVEAVNASTAADGYINYTASGIRDSSMEIAFEDLASIADPLIAVPGGSRVEIPIQLEIPEKTFDGMVLGGIRVLKQNSEESDAMITNLYQYAVAVALTMNDDEVCPHMELVDVAAGLKNYRAAVTARVRNARPAPAKEVKVMARLFQEGESTPVYTLEKEIDMAPSAVWNCILSDQAGYGYPAGNYVFRLRMEWEEEVWEFEEPLVITAGEADNINHNAVNQQQAATASASKWTYLLWGLGILVLLLLAALLIVVIKRKQP